MANKGIAVSVTSLSNPQKTGFLTKQGGSIKTWKKRWFVLKGDTIYYFKTQKDQTVTGFITLEPTTLCKYEGEKKKCYFFSVSTPKRMYSIYAETEPSAKDWVEAINSAINTLKNGGVPANNSTSSIKPATTTPTTAPAVPAPAPAPTPTPAASPKVEEPNIEIKPSELRPAVGTENSQVSPRDLLRLAKGVIPFLQDEESKVLEFWQIWSESFPPLGTLTSTKSTFGYYLSTSTDMQKLSWRMDGTQSLFIQRMVDFFWNVGAPENEIDRLNEVGTLINPLRIGSWIDMSAKGGMDGGWYFPVDIPVELALEVGDPGDSTQVLKEWAKVNGVGLCFSVGRDMGAAPPRQTQIKVKLPEATFEEQLKLALDAFAKFDFPALPPEALAILNETKPTGMSLAIVTCSECFVRIGLLTPNPDSEVKMRLCKLTGGDIENLAALEGTIGKEPFFAEYQMLRAGFGYWVYKEGFDVVFHYMVGEENH